MPIPPFGWKELEPPDIDATNLELDRAQTAEYSEGLVITERHRAESADKSERESAEQSVKEWVCPKQHCDDTIFCASLPN